jgi:hypothetical protein
VRWEEHYHEREVYMYEEMRPPVERSEREFIERERWRDRRDEYEVQKVVDRWDNRSPMHLSRLDPREEERWMEKYDMARMEAIERERYRDRSREVYPPLEVDRWRYRGDVYPEEIEMEIWREQQPRPRGKQGKAQKRKARKAEAAAQLQLQRPPIPDIPSQAEAMRRQEPKRPASVGRGDGQRPKRAAQKVVPPQSEVNHGQTESRTKDNRRWNQGEQMRGPNVQPVAVEKEGNRPRRADGKGARPVDMRQLENRRERYSGGHSFA